MERKYFGLVFILQIHMIQLTHNKNIMHLIYWIMLQHMIRYSVQSISKKCFKGDTMLHHLIRSCCKRIKVFVSLASAAQLAAAKKQNLAAVTSHSFTVSIYSFKLKPGRLDDSLRIKRIWSPGKLI
jgi:hypothetical protein